MKIIIEGMTSGQGGKESYIINMYRKMLLKGYDFTFIAYDSEIAYEKEIRSNGSKIVHIPPRNAGLFKYKKALNDLFMSQKFDVLWAHKTSLSSCEIFEIAKKNNIEVRIVHSHSSSNMGSLFTYIMHKFNRIIIPNLATDCLACSNEAADWFYKKGTATIVKNGFDIDRFKFNSLLRNDIRSRMNLEDKFVIGHIGRFGAEKNHIKLLEIFYNYYLINPSSVLVLCGDGEERPRIEAKIKELNIGHHVLLLGVINNVNEVLQAIDVIVMPSLFEGLPYAILEAQASGLKCVVSDTVSRESDVLRWNKFIPLSADSELWANSIRNIDYNYDRGMAASILAENGFDINDCVNQVDIIIQRGKTGD